MISFLSRCQHAVQNQGFFPFIARQIGTRYNRYFHARLAIWKWKPGMPLFESLPEQDGTSAVQIERFDSADNIPANMMTELIAGANTDFKMQMEEEFDEGGVLWVGSMEQKVAGYQWSKRGKFVDHWHCELAADDMLIYSTVTFYAFRGRRLSPTISAAICQSETGNNGCAYADCMVWNQPAVRFLERTGFQKIDERKPLIGHPD